MKREWNIWDLIAWIILAGILIWLILKTFGVINTPAWLEYAPLYGVVYIAGWQIHKLAGVSEDVKELKRFKEATIKEIHQIKNECIKNY